MSLTKAIQRMSNIVNYTYNLYSLDLDEYIKNTNIQLKSQIIVNMI